MARSPEDSRRRYRQGLLLGFTLSEVMILVIGALLLSLGVVIGRVAKDLKHAQGEVERCQVVLMAVPNCERVLSEVREAFPGYSESTIDDLFTELRLASAKAKRWDRVAASLPGLSDSEISSKLEELEVAVRPQAPPGDLAELHVKLAESDRRVADAEKQAAYWMEKAKAIAGRGGLDYPPCWSDGAGRPVYLFEVGIFDDGLSVKAIAPPDRRVEFEQLGFDAAVLARRQSALEFESRTRGIAEQAKKSNCRHFVRVLDRAQTKASYKNQLQTIERHFYKFESGS